MGFGKAIAACSRATSGAHRYGISQNALQHTSAISAFAA